MHGECFRNSEEGDRFKVNCFVWFFTTSTYPFESRNGVGHLIDDQIGDFAVKRGAALLDVRLDALGKVFLDDGVDAVIGGNEDTGLLALTELLHLANAVLDFTQVTGVLLSLARLFALCLSAADGEKANDDN
ncbi:hypothetical protein TYRP_000151 [Tyrophagus putrescentiae]|nr:hypothetical protein TYRP_000151 [Tyrophagus putrescentiae]